MTNTPTPQALALALRLEFNRSKLPLAGEGFVRLSIEVPAQAASASTPRRGLALAIALDCSGSMSEPGGSPDGSPMSFGLSSAASDLGNSKMERCRSAVWEAVSLLGPDDMASLTAFSSMAKTLFPMSPMTPENKALFKASLDKVQASGGTALHDGWSEAGREAAKGIDRGLLCRVAMLTDGEASTGERNPEVLAKHSATLAGLGVSTSCFGVGARFNEDLLCAMADAGEGNFRYIPDAMLAAAAAIDEVNGLGATAGRRAKLTLVGGEGIEEVEVLNGFDMDGQAMRLPTLLAGRPIEVIARVKLSAAGSAASIQAEVVWENRDGIAQSAMGEATVGLASADECAALPEDVEVSGAAAALLASREKLAMAKKLSVGDFAGAGASLENARQLMASMSGYSGAALEMAGIDALAASMASGDAQTTRKAAFTQSYTRSKNQTTTAPLPKPDSSQP